MMNRCVGLLAGVLVIGSGLAGSGAALAQACVPIPARSGAYLTPILSDAGVEGFVEDPHETFGLGLLLAPGLLSRTPANAVLASCFDPVHPPSQQVMAQINREMQFLDEYGQRFNIAARWPGTDNQPITLTWSLVPDGLSIAGAPSTLFATMDSQFGNNRNLWITQIQASFDRWSQLSGITFTRVTASGVAWDDGASWGSGSSSTRGTIRISMKNIDGPGGILAQNYYPSTNGLGGDMIIDSSETWGNSANNFRFFRNTLAHEMGHGLGLAHVCPANGTKLMEPLLSTNFDGPRHDEVRGVQTSYGDKYEPNNTAATATVMLPTTVGSVIGPSIPPAPTISNGSLTGIAAVADTDFFRSSAGVPLLATVTVAPVGLPYDNSTQNTDGSCNSGSFVDSASATNLAFDVRASNGTTVWAIAAAAPAGAAESAVVLLSAGDYYIRVYRSDAVGDNQLYVLTVSGATVPAVSASDGTFSARINVSWTNVPNATEYAIFRGTTTTRTAATLLASVTPPTTTYDDTTAALGTTYFYWVEAVQGGGGRRPLAGPDSGARAGTAQNDACANASTLTTGTPLNGSTVLATADGSAACGGTSGPDVWFRYTATCSGTVRFDTCGSNFDTVLSLHAACPGSDANLLGCNDNNEGGCGTATASALVVGVTAGQQYLLRLAGRNGATGDYTLAANLLAPINDVCANATTVTDGTYVFTTCGANTDGPTESIGCNSSQDPQITSDIWYRYNVATRGVLTVDLCASAYNTKLGIYLGACPTTSSVIACGVNECAITRSRVAINVVPGQSLLLRVGGGVGQSGTGVMNITLSPLCGSADFDGDGDAGTDADIQAFFACLAGACCPTCGSVDFDADGDTGTDSDVEAFFRVLAGQPC